MLRSTRKRLGMAMSLGIAAVVAGGLAPTSAGACSAASVASSTNDNWGDDFELNDARADAGAQGHCRVANDILRNVEDVLNRNLTRNLTELLSDNANDNADHNLNGNIRDVFRGGAVSL